MIYLGRFETRKNVSPSSKPPFVRRCQIIDLLIVDAKDCSDGGDTVSFTVFMPFHVGEVPRKYLSYLIDTVYAGTITLC
jgi:hypothetical protein